MLERWLFWGTLGLMLLQALIILAGLVWFALGERCDRN